MACIFCSKDSHDSKDCKWGALDAFKHYIDNERAELPESTLPFAYEMFSEGWKARNIFELKQKENPT